MPPPSAPPPPKSRPLQSMKESMGVRKVVRSASLTSASIKLHTHTARLAALHGALAEYQSSLASADHARVAAFLALGGVYGRNTVANPAAAARAPNPVKRAFANDSACVVSIKNHFGHHPASPLAPPKPRSKSEDGAPPALAPSAFSPGDTAAAPPVLHPNTSPFMLDKFSHHILGYLASLLSVLASLPPQFDAVDKLRRERDHYKGKVDALGAGKAPDAARLARNSGKLEASAAAYAAACAALCAAVDEAVDEGWREARPLALKLVQFERNYALVGAAVAEDLAATEAQLAEGGGGEGG
ncbi:hypothetical protein TeGR_g8420, partial [Tetraparma gracilis]